MPFPRIVRFNAYALNLHTAELTKHGLRIKLQRQPSHILVLLVTNAGRIVSREELRKSLWPDDTFVDFDHGLNNAINRIREVLCDSITAPRYIETIPKQGYRFLATLEELESAPAQGPLLDALRLAPTGANDGGAAISGKPTHSSTTIGKSALRVAQLLGIFALIVSMGARSFPPDSNQLHLRSVAVLPLSNLTGDTSQEFLADGMTDALITDLAQIRSIRVISRTSAMRYKASAKSLPEIAKELGVESVVEGSVARSGDRVRVNAQLIDAESDRHVWAKAYEGKMQDVLTLQSNVALAIASEIQTQMTPDEHQRIAHARQIQPEAYEAYLKGRFYTREYANSSEDGIPFLKRAIELDPGFAAAHSALAEVYEWNGATFQDARREAQIAIQLDDNLAEPHHVLAWVKHTLDWDSAGAEKEYRRSFELSPGDAEAHESYGVFLSQQGKHAEALAEMEIARRSNPISTKLNLLTGLVLYSDHRYDEALASFHRVLELSPEVLGAERQMLRVYEQKGDFEKAIEIYPKVAPWFDIDHTRALAQSQEMRESFNQSGSTGYWRTLLKQELQLNDYWRASVAWAHLGNNDKAIEVLERNYRDHFHGLRWWLKAEPAFDQLRTDPRFQDLVRRVGLPPDGPS